MVLSSNASRHILFLVPYTPNPIRTRPYNLILRLVEHGHQLTVLTLVNDATEWDDLKVLRDKGINVIAERLSRRRSIGNSLTAFPSPDPIQAAYCWQPELARQLRDLLASPNGRPVDIVHVEHLRGARYGLLARSAITAAGLPTPVVWDSVDSISHLFRQASVQSVNRFGRLITRLELPRTERYESRMLGEFDAVLTTSPVDRDVLVQLAADYQLDDPPIHVLPNGVDLDRFRPDPSVERDPATLVLSGKMSYHANVTMAVYLVREVMPHVWISRPETRVMIVGKDPSAAVQSLAADSRVIVTGAVPEIRSFLNRATIAVAPIVYSAGVQNKVLEAMACATPVVTTMHALGGLEVTPDRHLLIGDGPDGLAAAVIDLLDNPEKRAAIAKAGRVYVENNHNWLSIGNRLSNLYELLIAARLTIADI